MAKSAHIENEREGNRRRNDQPHRRDTSHAQQTHCDERNPRQHIAQRERFL